VKETGTIFIPCNISVGKLQETKPPGNLDMK